MNKGSKKSAGGTVVRSIIRSGLLVAVALAASGITSAQDKKDEIHFSPVKNPATPAAITPPAGNHAFVVGHAEGTQGYICFPEGSGVSWTVIAARPEATLFTNFFGGAVRIITHFLSPDTNPNQFAPSPLPFANPTWQSSFDSSKVWGQSVGSIVAGSDPSCPNTGSIPCLLLQAVGSAQGPTGGQLMTRTTYVQRLNTNGGAAPATGCSVPADAGKQSLVPYTADYYFFRADH